MYVRNQISLYRTFLTAQLFLQKNSWKAVLTLAYQSFGVVYGDLSTSPLYVFKSTFYGSKVRLSDTDEEILGVLSFIFWTFTLIPALKYVFIVLRADDNGEGMLFFPPERQSENNNFYFF